MITPDKHEDNDKPKGPVIPAGTEQETGITRGQTEKPDENVLIEKQKIRQNDNENGGLNEKNN